MLVVGYWLYPRIVLHFLYCLTVLEFDIIFLRLLDVNKQIKKWKHTNGEFSGMSGNPSAIPIVCRDTPLSLPVWYVHRSYGVISNVKAHRPGEDPFHWLIKILADSEFKYLGSPTFIKGMPNWRFTYFLAGRIAQRAIAGYCQPVSGGSWPQHRHTH